MVVTVGRPASDPVTGACPRAELLPRLEAELTRAARASGSCAVFLFDVDYFKTVNDVFGHLRGDQALRQLADRIKGLVRGYDVLFRYGGDEFVLLLPETDATEAARLALRLTGEVRSSPFPGDPPLHLSVSLGVATYPQDGTDPAALLDRADRRNYLAKRRGRGGAVADDAETGTEPTSTRLWERDAGLAATHEFLTRLRVEGRGALWVHGQPGAGHTRFLDEVATIAALRGFAVVPVSAGAVSGPAAPPAPRAAEPDAADRPPAQPNGAGLRAGPGDAGTATEQTEARQVAEPNGTALRAGPDDAGTATEQTEARRAAEPNGTGPGAGPGAGGPGADRARAGVLLLADVPGAGGADELAAATAAVAARLSAGPHAPPVLGLVYATAGAGTDNAAGLAGAAGLPELGAVELAPWSPAALRIWLRTQLVGEPSRTLVSWLAGRTGGLPAAAVRELARLQERNGLVRTETDGWTLSPTVLGRPRRRTRLPAQLTGLVGRDQERRQVSDLLADARLVTLVGPGGIGKTRLSLAVAAAVADGFDDGVVFVPLAETTGGARVAPALAHALGVAEVPGEPLLDTLVDYLAEASMLLVLDNFEQVLDAGPVVAELLAAAPDVSVLVTSREPLSLYGEQVFRVPPLRMPDAGGVVGGGAAGGAVAAAVAEFPALALFEQRARAANADFALSAETLPAVAELCRRLDGLPLAIELAAARADRLDPAALLARLAEHLDLPGAGARNRPERQQSLRGALDWSFHLLDPDQQRVFTALAAFTGGCTAEAALAVAGPPPADPPPADPPPADPPPADPPPADPGPADPADADTAGDGPAGWLVPLLTALVDKSLLVAEPEPGTEPGTGTRYRMLETIRAYAAARLAADPTADAVHRRHAAYHASFAERSAVGLTGPEQARWTERIEREHENLRAAVEWALAHGDMTTAGRICLGLWRFWRHGSHIGEGRDWLDRVLAAPPADGAAGSTGAADAGDAADTAGAADAAGAADTAGAADAAGASAPTGDGRMQARLLYAATVLATTQDDLETAYGLGTSCLALAEAADDRETMAQAHNAMGAVTIGTGDYPLAARHLEQCLALFQELDQPQGTAGALGNLAKLALRQGELAAASDYIDRCLKLERSTGNTFGLVLGLEFRGQILLAQGDVPAARASLEDSLTLSRSIGDVYGEAMALHQLGLAAHRDGNRQQAVTLLTVALLRRHEAGDREDLAISLDSVGALAVEADPALAVRLLAAADGLRGRHRLPTPPDVAAQRAPTLAAARTCLDNRAFAAAWSGGRNAPLDLIIDQALDLSPEH